MTSIFADNYDAVFERLQAPASRNTNAVGGGAQPGKDFAAVLSDLETAKARNTEQKHGLSAGPATEPAEHPPPLTNLEGPEADEVRARLGTHEDAYRHVPVPPLPMLPDVNEADYGVKSLPPPSVEQSRAPAVPQIIAANRYEDVVRTPGIPKPVSLTKREIENIIVTAGKFHGVDPALGLAVAQAESSFITDAVSQDGHFSKGVFQLLDSTAHEMLQHSGVQEAYDPFDPAMNSYLGLGYLRRLFDMFRVATPLTSETSTVAAKSAPELEKLAVAAYNAGQGSVARAQAKALAEGNNPAEYAAVEPHLPVSTREYVRRVLEHKTKFAALSNETRNV